MRSFFYILRKTFILVLLCSSHILSAQSVGVNTSSPNSNAALDVVSTNKGVLIPRVSLSSSTSASPLGAFVAGMMVYNTATAGDVTPGFYLCNGTKWEKAGGGWSLKGNSGTSSSIDFIGTTDNQDIVFKRNNIRAGFISSDSKSSTSFGINSLDPASIGSGNTAIGSNVLFNNTFGEVNIGLGVQPLYNNTVGDLNIGIGYLALYNNKSGNGGIAIGNYAMENVNNTLTSFENTNIAIGTSALKGSTIASNNTGANNVVIGLEAMKDNSSGSYNIALGTNALFKNATGTSNIGIGFQSLFNNVGGIQNTAIGTFSLIANNGVNNTAFGYAAGYSNYGNNNVFLGKEAGFYELGSNKLYINNGNGDESNTLIYGEFDNDKLRINNKLGIGMNSQSFPLELKAISNGNDDLLKLYNSSGIAKWHLNLLPNGSLNFTETGVADYRLVLAPGGKVLLGNKEATGYKLCVDGKIACTEVRVQPSNLWPDYVFSSKYTLMSISDLEKSIKKEKHLPGIPSAKEINSDGIQVGEMQRKMMEKIEELTLYIIDLNKKIESLQSENKSQADQIKNLRKG